MKGASVDRAAAGALALVYAVGLIAHLYSPARGLVMLLTPSVLFAGGAAVLLLTARGGSVRRASYAAWCAIVTAATFAAELAGVHTGAIFGSYEYGTVLGLKAAGVPLIIGFNWALVVLGASVAAGRLLAPLEHAGSREAAEQDRLPQAAGGARPPEVARGSRLPQAAGRAGRALLFAALAGAVSALFDLAMEPAATALGYWSWRDGVIPFRNYAAWFLLAAAAALLLRALQVRLESRLPIAYLVVQWSFFAGLDVGIVRHIS